MLVRAKNRAKKYGLPFDLTANDIRIPATCPVLGIPLNTLPGTQPPGGGRGSGSLTDHSPSLDKLDPALGYVRGNVVVVSMRANRLKGELSPDEMISLGKRFKKIQRKLQKELNETVCK